MTDYHFYNVGGEKSRGLRGLIVPMRRVLRRILRPIFVRQTEILTHFGGRIDATEVAIQGLHARHDATSDQMQAAIAFGWDYVAMARRLAALEDQVQQLTARDERGTALPFPDRSDAPRHAEAS